MKSPFAEKLATYLRADADLHEKQLFEKMGSEFESFDSELPSEDPLRGLPFTFWDSWIDERNHGFPGFYRGINKESWPKLARTVADSIELGIQVSTPELLENFSPAPSLFHRLKKIISTFRSAN